MSCPQKMNIFITSGNRVLLGILISFPSLNLQVEVVSALSGDLRVSIADSSHAEEDDVIGLHIFKRSGLGSSSRYQY